MENTIKKPAVSRADLLKIFAKDDRPGLVNCAELVGFYQKDAEKNSILKINGTHRIDGTRRIGTSKIPEKVVVEHKKTLSLKKSPLVDFWFHAEFEEVAENE